MTDRKILLTGAAGRIGSFLTRYRVSSTRISAPDSSSVVRSLNIVVSRSDGFGAFVGESKEDRAWLVHHTERENVTEIEIEAQDDAAI